MPDLTDDPRFPRPPGMTDAEYVARRRACRSLAEEQVAAARKELGMDPEEDGEAPVGEEGGPKMDKKRTIRIKVISDGEPHGTKIIDVETGKEIRRVAGLKIDFPQGGGYAPIAHLELHFTPIELEMEGLVEGSCPYCRQRFLVDEVFKKDGES